MDSNDANLTPLERQVLTQYPYPVAVGYRRILEAATWEAKAKRTIEVFDFSMRTLALGLISQYSLRDVGKVKDPALDLVLREQLPRGPSLGSWKNIFFTALRAYKDKRELFFIPELYDLYWDTSRLPHRARRELSEPYDRFINWRNKVVHGVPPISDDEWRPIAEELLGRLNRILEDFTFIQQYDLVLVVERVDSASYKCISYTGEHPRTLPDARTFAQNLENGLLYLAKGQECLALHPLLIIWPELLLTDNPSDAPRDAAMYDNFTSTTVNYLAAARGSGRARPERRGRICPSFDAGSTSCGTY
jgi:hypothetical protein